MKKQPKKDKHAGHKMDAVSSNKLEMAYDMGNRFWIFRAAFLSR